MSGREWKPGDMAMVDFPQWGAGGKDTTYEPTRVVRYESGWVRADDPNDFVNDNERTQHLEPRPLVVIDPEDDEQVDRLAKDFHESDHIAPWHDLHSETRAQITDALQAALRSFLEPPKPEEPTDPAVRVKVNGSEWAKVGPWWVCADLGEVPRDWAYLADAVTSDA